MEDQRHPGQENQVVEFYRSNPQAQAQLRAPLFEDKVIDFIIDLAKVSEREVTADALREEEKAAAAEEPKKAAKKPAKKATKSKAKAKDAGDDAAAGGDEAEGEG